MKRIRTYVFVFISTPRHWRRGFGTGGSAGILPAVAGMLPDNADHEDTPRGAGRNPPIMYAAQEIAGNMPATAGNMPVLPDHLLWTWFVYNPRSPSKPS
jgi:hypothetical protein